MLGSVLLLIAMIGPMVLLATFLHYLFPVENVNGFDQWVPAIVSALSAWSFFTSWLWFYLFNLYLSLPVFLLALVLHLYTVRKNLNPKLIRINTALLIATILMGFVSFLYFDI